MIRHELEIDQKNNQPTSNFLDIFLKLLGTLQGFQVSGFQVSRNPKTADGLLTLIVSQY